MGVKQLQNILQNEIMPNWPLKTKEKFPEFYNDLLEVTDYLSEGCPIRQRFWHLLNGQILPKCETCHKPARWYRQEQTYGRFCSQACVNRSESVKEKSKQTMLDRYGVEHSLQSEELQIKKIETTKERYGVEHYSQTDEWHETRIQQLKEQYPLGNQREYSHVYNDIPVSSTSNIDKQYVIDYYNYCLDNNIKLTKLPENYLNAIDNILSELNIINFNNIHQNMYHIINHNTYPKCIICNEDCNLWIGTKYSYTCSDKCKHIVIRNKLKTFYNTEEGKRVTSEKNERISKSLNKHYSSIPKKIKQPKNFRNTSIQKLNIPNVIDDKSLQNFLHEEHVTKQKTYTQIAKETDIRHDIIARWASRLGIETRNYYCSYEQVEIENYINSLGCETKRNVRSIISGELDIVIESEKIAIEYCGLYWHSYPHKSKSYHKNKMIKANNAGYRLVTIFQNEWVYDPELVKQRLKNVIEQNEIYPDDSTITIDLRWEDRDILINDGYVLSNCIEPDYFYIRNDKLFSKDNFLNNVLPSLTGYNNCLSIEENLINMNIFKIYDCGYEEYSRTNF